MDWTTFFKDYGQSLFTLGGVVLGSFITFLISFLNNRFQAKERDKDRQEQRREARIQAIEKSVISDIDKAMDLLASLVKVLSEYGGYNFRNQILEEGRVKDILSPDEYERTIKSNIELHSARAQEIVTLIDSAGRFLYSFDDEISSEYDTLLESVRSYIASKNPENKNMDDKAEYVFKKAGNLQRKLREKKVAIRDTIK